MVGVVVVIVVVAVIVAVIVAVVVVIAATTMWLLSLSYTKSNPRDAKKEKSDNSDKWIARFSFKIYYW